MKKLLALVLTLMLALPGLSMAEGSFGIIGSADGPTNILVAGKAFTNLTETALAAGRRVTETLTFTEFSGVDTGDPAMDAAMTDLFKALGVSVSRQGDEYDVALTLSGQEALTLGGVVSGEDLYLASNMIGGAVVINAEEVEPVANRILDMLVLMEAMTEEEASLLREQIAAMMESFTVAMEASAASAPAMDDLEQLDYSALEQLLPMIMAKVTPVESIIVPRMCDPAVSGVQLVLTNADFTSGMKSFYQFLLDNPALMDYIGSMFGYPTEAEIAANWESAGELYMAFGIYKSEEEYRAAQKTFASVVREVMAEADARKIIDGEYVVTLYADEAGEPVYGTLTLPLYIAGETLVEGEAAPGETMTISITYTRQTVAQGVAHVCNIDVDGTGVTIDALVNEGGTTITMTGVEPEFEPAKLLDMSIASAASETTPGVTCMDVTATLYDGADNAVLEIAYDGEYEFTDVRRYISGKVTLTAYEFEYVDHDEAWTAVPTTITLEFSTETLINGVDYSGLASFAIEADGMRIAAQLVSETCDPEPSIMSGEVIRPAELDDTAFSNWFVSVMNAFSTWMTTALTMLPESVLTMIIYSGMM